MFTEGHVMAGITNIMKKVRKIAIFLTFLQGTQIG
jgi:hypothetical protein